MSAYTALSTLARRRFALSAHTPREIVVPLITPVLFALVIAPALNQVVGGFTPGVDYVSFVALGTVGLLIPLNTMFAGLGVIVDRQAGARRELLAAPIRRSLLVLSNLTVALAITTLQIVVLIVAAALRGAAFPASGTGVLWFVGATLLFAIGMYGIAETLASRIGKQEEYIGAVPAIAIVPWFFAGSLFPIAALPGALTAFAKVLPLTHVLAVIRWALGVDPSGTGLHAIWGMSDPTAMAALSLGVVAVFAAAMTAIAIRVFTRSAVQ
jgi:ABC-2 type transport system permease protein